MNAANPGDRQACHGCGGRGMVAGYKQIDFGVWTGSKVIDEPCPDCGGTGKSQSGANLDPALVSALARIAKLEQQRADLFAALCRVVKDRLFCDLNQCRPNGADPEVPVSEYRVETRYAVALASAEAVLSDGVVMAYASRPDAERIARALAALDRSEREPQSDIGSCRGGHPHYCPNCDRTFTAPPPNGVDMDRAIALVSARAKIAQLEARHGCINCDGEFGPIAYETDMLGPFCVACWTAVKAQASAQPQTRPCTVPLCVGSQPVEEPQP